MGSWGWKPQDLSGLSLFSIPWCYHLPWGSQNPAFMGFNWGWSQASWYNHWPFVIKFSISMMYGPQRDWGVIVLTLSSADGKFWSPVPSRLYLRSHPSLISWFIKIYKIPRLQVAWSINRDRNQIWIFLWRYSRIRGKAVTWNIASVMRSLI